MPPDDILGQPNLLGGNRLFSGLTICVACGDQKAAVVVKAVLDSLSCRAVIVVRSGKEFMERLRRDPIDILVADEALQDMAGTELVRQLRRLARSPFRDLPVILLNRSRQQNDVLAALNAGANEYVLKPFSAKSLLSAVHAVIEQPRPFVVSPFYVGPDRRMPSSLTTLLPPRPQGKCKRVSAPRAVTSPDGTLPDTHASPILLPVDWRLKRKMGLSIPEELVLSHETIASAESTMAQARIEFMQNVEELVAELLTYNRLLFQRPDRYAVTIEAIRHIASLIECRTLDLGYRRVPEVARLLRECCDSHFVAGHRVSLFLLEKHALTLMAMLQAGQQGDSGQIGESLLKDLARQVSHYRLTS